MRCGILSWILHLSISTILSNESGFKIQDRAAHLHDLIRELIGDSQTAFQKRRLRIQFDPPLPHYSAATPNSTAQRGACKVCYANSKAVSKTYYYCFECSNPSINKYFWIHPECMRDFHSEEFQMHYQVSGKRSSLRVRFT